MTPEETLGHKLILGGDVRYESARGAAVFRANKPTRYPKAIVLAETADDVVAAVKLARSRGWKVAVRSGGHSWVSAHIRDGSLLIDMSRLNAIDLDLQAGTVWAQTGAKGRAVNDALAPHGLMVPTGHANTVACGGFLLGGGFGWNYRHWGIGAKQVQAIELVTAEGELIRADATQNQDYYWAARGAGPGFFGVIVRYLLGPLRKRPSHMRVNAYTFAAQDLEPFLHWAYEIFPKLPTWVEFVGSTTAYGPDGDWADPVRFSVVGMTFANSEEEAEQVRAIFDTCPVKHLAIARRDNLPTTLEERYEGGTAADPEGFRFAVDNIYSDAPVSEIAPRLKALITSMPTPRTHVFWQIQGPRPDFSEMAFSGWGETYIAAYPLWTDPAQDPEMRAWPVREMRKLGPIANGEAQMSDENMSQHPQNYLTPDKAARLETLRAKYDPDRLFVGYLRPDEVPQV